MRFAHPEEVANWPEPNLINPETRGPEIYIIYAIFAFAATAAVAMRFYIRVFERRWVGADDWMLGFAYLCMLGDMGTVLWGFNRFQWDRHFWDSYHVEYLVRTFTPNFFATELSNMLIGLSWRQSSHGREAFLGYCSLLHSLLAHRSILSIAQAHRCSSTPHLEVGSSRNYILQYRNLLQLCLHCGVPLPVRILSTRLLYLLSTSGILSNTFNGRAKVTASMRSMRTPLWQH